MVTWLCTIQTDKPDVACLASVVLIELLKKFWQPWSCLCHTDNAVCFTKNKKKVEKQKIILSVFSALVIYGDYIATTQRLICFPIDGCFYKVFWDLSVYRKILLPAGFSPKLIEERALSGAKREFTHTAIKTVTLFIWSSKDFLTVCSLRIQYQHVI